MVLIPNPIFNETFNLLDFDSKLFEKSVVVSGYTSSDFLDDFKSKDCELNVSLKMGFGIMRKISNLKWNFYDLQFFTVENLRKLEI